MPEQSLVKRHTRRVYRVEGVGAVVVAHDEFSVRLDDNPAYVTDDEASALAGAIQSAVEDNTALTGGDTCDDGEILSPST